MLEHIFAGVVAKYKNRLLNPREENILFFFQVKYNIDCVLITRSKTCMVGFETFFKTSPIIIPGCYACMNRYNDCSVGSGWVINVLGLGNES